MKLLNYPHFKTLQLKRNYFVQTNTHSPYMLNQTSIQANQAWEGEAATIEK